MISELAVTLRNNKDSFIMNTLKTIFFVLYLLLLPVVLYFLYKSFENETIKICCTFIFIGITGAFVAVSFNSHLERLERNSQKAAEQRLLFLAQMPENATFKETESTLHFEDGSKQVTFRRTESKRLNTPDKRRQVVSHGNIKEYDKDGNLINTSFFMT